MPARENVKCDVGYEFCYRKTQTSAFAGKLKKKKHNNCYPAVGPLPVCSVVARICGKRY